MLKWTLFNLWQRSFIQRAGRPYRTNLFLFKGTLWSFWPVCPCVWTPLSSLNCWFCCLLSHKTSNFTRYCMLSGWNTQSCTHTDILSYTHTQNLAKLFWLNACLAACLNTHTQTHRRTHAHGCSTALLFKLMWMLSRHPTSPICSTEALAWESRVTPLALMQIHSAHTRTHTLTDTLNSPADKQKDRETDRHGKQRAM